LWSEHRSGGVVDQTLSLIALRDRWHRRSRHGGFENELMPFPGELRADLDNVVLLPHLRQCTLETRTAPWVMIVIEEYRGLPDGREPQLAAWRESVLRTSRQPLRFQEPARMLRAMSR